MILANDSPLRTRASRSSLIKMCELASIISPSGQHAFVIKGMAPPGVQIESISKGCSRFVLPDIVTIALLVAYPEMALWLPSTIG